MRKYYILTASILVNLCLGGVYAWSIFVPELVAQFGYTTAQTQMVFGTIVCFLTLAMLFAGRVENIIGPRRMLMICSVLMLTGYLLGSLSGTHFFVLWLGCGAICGIGIGFGYVSVLAVCLRWFERRKGVACGMVLAGYGFSAIMLSFIVQLLLSSGWGVMSIFRFLAIVFGAVLFLCAMVITNPEHYSVKRVIPTMKYRSLLCCPRFFVIAGAMGLGTFPGLMFIGNLKPLAFFLGYDDTVALVAIWLCSAGNTIGRIAGGFAHDRFKASSIKVILILAAISSLVFVVGDTGRIVFVVMVLISGISYGALISNIPAHVSAEYGHENFGRIYPLIFLIHGLTALVASPLAGYIYDHHQTYRPAMIVAGGVALLCFAGFVSAYRENNNQQELTVI